MKNFKKWFAFAALAALVTGFSACSDSWEEEMETSSSGSAMLKSTVVDEVTTKTINRCAGSGVGSYRMWGINLMTDDAIALTSSLSTYTGTSYHLYFYNEKVYATADTSGLGCPAIFMADEVSGVAVGTGDTACFSLIDSSNYQTYLSGKAFSTDSCATLPLPDSTYFRWGNNKLKRDSVKYDYYTKFLIGNNFQLSTPLTSPHDQTVYILKISGDEDDLYYAFMVYYFKAPGNDKYTTIKYKCLN